MLVYVDDMVVAGKSIAQVQIFKKDIGEIFNISDLGKLNGFLGSRSARTEKATLLQCVRSHTFTLLSVGIQTMGTRGGTSRRDWS